MSWTRRRAIRILGLVLLLGTAACAGGPSTPPSGGKIGGSVSVLAVWGGTEQQAFLDMLKPFEQQTGITVNYTGTRDINASLTAGLASGVLPDVAGLPGPAQMADYAKAGKLVDLDTVLDLSTYQKETSPGLVKLGTVKGKIVGVFPDASVKGLIWYDPKVVGDLTASAPKNWTDFQNLINQNSGKAKSAWCLSVESGAASGWPAADVLDSLILHDEGPDYYNSWWQGKIKWTDPGIVKAWQELGQMVATSYGGPNRILTANFANAGDPLFATTPGCLFLHQASFITGLGQFAKQTSLTDYNFFPFPSINSQYSGAVEGAGDVFGMFHKTAQSVAFMRYLVSAQAQTLFVSGGEFLSPNKNVTAYPNPMNQHLGAIIANSTAFVFTADNLMPTAMATAFWTGLLKYIQHPDQLNSVLANLDSVEADAYK